MSIGRACQWNGIRCIAAECIGQEHASLGSTPRICQWHIVRMAASFIHVLESGQHLSWWSSVLTHLNLWIIHLSVPLMETQSGSFGIVCPVQANNIAQMTSVVFRKRARAVLKKHGAELNCNRSQLLG